MRRARETDARRVSSFPFGGVSARGKPLFRVASRVAKTDFRFERARRIFGGALSELAGDFDEGDATETRRIEGARALERVFVRSLPGETRVERGRARGEGGESSVDRVQWFGGGTS